MCIVPTNSVASATKIHSIPCTLTSESEDNILSTLLIYSNDLSSSEHGGGAMIIAIPLRISDEHVVFLNINEEKFTEERNIIQGRFKSFLETTKSRSMDKSFEYALVHEIGGYLVSVVSSIDSLGTSIHWSSFGGKPDNYDQLIRPLSDISIYPNKTGFRWVYIVCQSQENKTIKGSGIGVVLSGFKDAYIPTAHEERHDLDLKQQYDYEAYLYCTQHSTPLLNSHKLFEPFVAEVDEQIAENLNFRVDETEQSLSAKYVNMSVPGCFTSLLRSAKVTAVSLNGSNAPDMKVMFEDMLSVFAFKVKCEANNGNVQIPYHHKFRALLESIALYCESKHTLVEKYTNTLKISYTCDICRQPIKKDTRWECRECDFDICSRCRMRKIASS